MGYQSEPRQGNQPKKAAMISTKITMVAAIMMVKRRWPSSVRRLKVFCILVKKTRDSVKQVQQISHILGQMAIPDIADFSNKILRKHT